MTQEKHKISELLTLLAATEYLYKQGTADHVPPEKRYYHPEGRHTGSRGGRFSIIGVETDPHGDPLGRPVPTLTPGMENESVRAWIERDPEAQHVLNTLSQHGDPYVVGGGVRDALLGVPSKDVDIEVYGLTIDELSDIVQKDFGGKQDQVGKVYGVFKVGNFDISLPRTETKVGEKHTDFDVEPNPDLPPELAARRRDFTINALMYDYKNDQVLDFFGGIQDLEAKRIKHVSPETFVEDPLRVYRAAQFAARFDFSIDSSTVELARSMDLSEISNERVFGEFEKLLLKSSTPSTGIQALDDMGVLDAQFPEISALKNTHQRSDFHAEGDVFTHTKMTLDKAAEIIQRFPDQKDKTIIMLAALCHDLGKATTTTPDGRAIGHEAAGVPITEEFLGKLTNDRDILTTVPSLVENHLKPLQFHRDGASDAAFRRLINKHGTEYLNLLSAVSEADVSGRLVGYPDGSVGEPGTEENVWFRDKVKQVAEKAGGLKEGKIAPLITGKDLKDLGFKEGKELGSILRDVQKRQEEGEITSADEALDFVRATYKSEESDQHLSKQEVFPSQEWTTGFVPPEKRFYHLEGTHKGPRGGQFSIIGTEVDQHGASLQQAAQAQPPGPHDISELPVPSLQPVEQFHGDVPETGKSITLTLHHGKREMGKGADERRYATDAGDLGRGIYYSTDEGTAKGYGEVSSQELTFKNPLAVSARDIANPEQTGLAQKYKTIVSMHPGVSAEEKKRLALEGSTKLTEDLLEQGYDALIVSGYDSPKGHYTVVDLKPSEPLQQKKSEQPQMVERPKRSKYVRDYATDFHSEERIASFNKALRDPTTKEYQQLTDIMEYFVDAEYGKWRDDYSRFIEEGTSSAEEMNNRPIGNYRDPSVLIDALARDQELGRSQNEAPGWKAGDKGRRRKIKFGRGGDYPHQNHRGGHLIDTDSIEQVLTAFIGSKYPGNDGVDIPMKHIKRIKSIVLDGNRKLKGTGEIVGTAFSGKPLWHKAGVRSAIDWNYPIYDGARIELYSVDGELPPHYFDQHEQVKHDPALVAEMRENRVGGHQTLIHELGHAVYYNLPLWFKSNVQDEYIRAMESNSGFVSSYSKRTGDDHEFFAECYAAYFIHTKELEKRNPTMHRMMEQLFENAPENRQSTPEELKVTVTFNYLMGVWKATGKLGQPLVEYPIHKAEIDENTEEIVHSDPQGVILDMDPNYKNLPKRKDEDKFFNSEDWESYGKEIKKSEDLPELLTLLTAIEYMAKQEESAWARFEDWTWTLDESQKLRHAGGRHIGPNGGKYDVIGYEITQEGKLIGPGRVTGVAPPRGQVGLVGGEVSPSLQGQWNAPVQPNSQTADINDFVSVEEYAKGLTEVTGDEITKMLSTAYTQGLGNGKLDTTPIKPNIVRYNEEGGLVGITTFDGHWVAARPIDPENPAGGGKANILINQNVDGKVQATWEDKEGAKSVLYSWAWSANSERMNHAKIAKLMQSGVIDSLQKRMKIDMVRPKAYAGGPKSIALIKEAAAATMIILTTGRRPGGEGDSSEVSIPEEYRKKSPLAAMKKTKGSFIIKRDIISSMKDKDGEVVKYRLRTHGVSTLEGRHVNLNADGSVTLKFLGKAGKINEVRVTDPAIAKDLRRRKSKAGNTNQLYDVTAAQMNSYLKDQSKELGVTNKNLRTLMVTERAKEVIDSEPIPTIATIGSRPASQVGIAEFESSVEYAEVKALDGFLAAQKRNNKKQIGWASNAQRENHMRDWIQREQDKYKLDIVGEPASDAVGNTAAIAIAEYVNPDLFSEWDEYFQLELDDIISRPPMTKRRITSIRDRTKKIKNIRAMRTRERKKREAAKG